MKIYTLRISLDESAPEIWRRVEIPGDMTFGDLHDVIQIAMGWGDCHLHDFIVGEKRYSKPFEDDELYGSVPVDEDEVAIEEILRRKGRKFAYIYDMGDAWIHTVQVEAISEPEADVQYPRCLAGERACPPEDSGGCYGYYEKLAILKDPQGEEYEEIADWMGNDFDPDYFDIEQVNHVLMEFDEYISGWDRDE